MDRLSNKTSSRNFAAFLWHALFLALTTSFMDVDTVIPAMLINAGGGSFLLGLLTAIMLGGSSLMQLVFAGFLSGRPFKKKFLLAGIYLRVFALASLAALFFVSDNLNPALVIFLIFVFIALFSFSGAFANVSYVDIFGKSILNHRRKKFFTLQQTFNSVGLLASALIVREILKYYDYPSNYSILFLIAAMLLTIASGGFWRIKEMPSTKKPGIGFLQFLKMIPSEVKQNPNLKNYLFVINIMGLGMSILPFLLLLANEKFGLSDTSVGNFLVFRVLGMLLISLAIFRFSRKKGYKSILVTGVIIGALIPIGALILSDHQIWYPLIFVFSGAFFSIYKISISGILVEISNDDNRAVYTGIAGAGNILPAIFPLLAGSIISLFGYRVVFVIVSLMVLLAFIFIKNLKCK